LARPLPPWPRRLVLEVFRCRLAQIRAFGRCTCAPSFLAPHLAAHRRRLSLLPRFRPFVLAFRALLRFDALLRLGARSAGSIWMRPAFLGFLSPTMRMFELGAGFRSTHCPRGPRSFGFLPSWFPGHDVRGRIASVPVSTPKVCSFARLGVCPQPSSRLARTLARLVPSRRHPWGSSLQRFDFTLSRTPLGLPCPSVPWPFAPTIRVLPACCAGEVAEPRGTACFFNASPALLPGTSGGHRSVGFRISRRMRRDVVRPWLRRPLLAHVPNRCSFAGCQDVLGCPCRVHVSRRVFKLAATLRFSRLVRRVGRHC